MSQHFKECVIYGKYIMVVLTAARTKHKSQTCIFRIIWSQIFYLFKDRQLSEVFMSELYINPLHLNISIHILHTVFCTFTKVLTRRICLTIKSFFTC